MKLKYGMPLNFERWLAEHEHQLKPPVNNQQIWEDADFMITVVGGPNERTDFHDDPAEEYFWQIKGNANLLIWDQGNFERIHLKEGDMFLMAPHVIHSPQRPEENSLCLVVEHKRAPQAKDALQWFCACCGTRIRRFEMILESIVDDLPPVYQTFYGLSDDERRCTKCGEVHPGHDYRAWHKTLKQHYPSV